MSKKDNTFLEVILVMAFIVLPFLLAVLAMGATK